MIEERINEFEVRQYNPIWKIGRKDFGKKINRTSGIFGAVSKGLAFMPQRRSKRNWWRKKMERKGTRLDALSLKKKKNHSYNF